MKKARYHWFGMSNPVLSDLPAIKIDESDTICYGPDQVSIIKAIFGEGDETFDLTGIDSTGKSGRYAVGCQLVFIDLVMPDEYLGEFLLYLGFTIEKDIPDREITWEGLKAGSYEGWWNHREHKGEFFKVEEQVATPAATK